MNKKTTKEIILYLVGKLGDRIEGKKKMMKLMFLINHYDVLKKKLTSEDHFGLDFYIYNYGVFSQGVLGVISILIEEKKIEDGFPLKSKLPPVLNDPLKSKIDSIVEMFGLKTGYRLEIETLEMLGISPSEKNKFFGRRVSDLIKTNKPLTV